MIPAKPTTYGFNTFRSQLEARWAVFFDILGIRYMYEPKFFQIREEPRKLYCPDFYLPNYRSFLEIKPEPLTTVQREKMRLLARQTRCNVYTFFGDVGVPNERQQRGAFVDYGDAYYLVHARLSQSIRIRYPSDRLLLAKRPSNVVNAYGRWSGQYGWYECTDCAMLMLASADPTLRWQCACPEPLKAPHTPHSPRLLAAYKAANTQRFERAS